MRKFLCLFLFVLLPALHCPTAGAETGTAVPDTPPVYVTLWFDTEDYTSPEADGIILPLCRILEQHGIQATFKLVGEKARDLERKGQKDVIQALSRQDIGFHTTYHSQPPAVTAYLDRLEWSEGADEFIRREEAGFKDTRRIFQRTPICYGQPGDAWAPQVFAALRRWGVPLYLDEGTHVGLKGKPFYYCGLLNVYDMADRSTRMNLEGEADYQKGIAEFRLIYAKLTAEGGGLISIYYHPNEFDHTEFWDAVIWSHGANPPKTQWKYPRRRTPESRDRTLQDFSRYLTFMQSLPGVRFVTGTDMVNLYADKLPAVQFSASQVRELARSLIWDITFQKMNDVFLSPAETLSVLLRWYLRKPGENEVGAIPGLLGPFRQEAAEPPGNVGQWEFRNACADTLDFMSQQHHVPPAIWIGARPVLPADFMASLASEVLEDSPGGSLELRRGRFSAARYAAEESSSLFNWIIMPDGFRAPHVMELARLQCWSLKPAARDDASLANPKSRRR
jgi:hypothetical protein